MKKYQVLLTKKEWDALRLVTGNGWGDGDFRGYGGQNAKVQESAMKKLEDAKLITISNKIKRNNEKPKYVTIPQAKWLKEKGWDIPCDGRYYWNTTKYSFSPKGATQWNKNEDNYPAPEQWQVVEWLKINHGINVFPDMIKINKYGYRIIYNLDKALTEKISHLYDFNSLQTAYSAAFDYIKDNKIIK